jgi:hypothetical protein
LEAVRKGKKVERCREEKRETKKSREERSQRTDGNEKVM